MIAVLVTGIHFGIERKQYSRFAESKISGKMASWSLAIIVVLTFPLFANSVKSPYEVLTEANELSTQLLQVVNELIKDGPNYDVEANFPKDALAHAILFGDLLPQVHSWIENVKYPEYQQWVWNQFFAFAGTKDLHKSVESVKPLICRLIERAQFPDSMDYNAYPWRMLQQAVDLFYGRKLSVVEKLITEESNLTNQDNVYHSQILVLCEKLGVLTQQAINIIQEYPPENEDFQKKFFRFLLDVELDGDTYNDVTYILCIRTSKFRKNLKYMVYDNSKESARCALKHFVGVCS
uniref:Uncharacterized protein n=1 Tax=Spongospora subterranea TaxID=70186 RepID=A0A0H5QWN3_9EUKA|eukprot:CRZ06162.1 hypothetical protein [Spongospora subterranea]